MTSRLSFGLAISLVITVAVLTACASEPPPLPPPNVHVPATSTADVLSLLQNASLLRVSLSDDEISRIEGHLYPGVEEVSQTLRNCNNNNYVAYQDIGTVDDTQRECSSLGGEIIQDLGAGSTAGEIALVRGCALPRATGLMFDDDGCSFLGELYEDRSEPDMALAVFQNAAKCQGIPHATADVHVITGRGQDVANDELIHCLAQKAELLGKLHRTDEERIAYAQLCDDAADLGACGILKSLGAPVNIEQAEQRQAALEAADRASAAAYEAASARAESQSDAKNAALLGVLQNVAGSDPNAIVNAANRQAANMIAVGAANDAARAQVSLERQEAAGEDGQPAAIFAASATNSVASQSAQPVTLPAQGDAASNGQPNAPALTNGCIVVRPSSNGSYWSFTNNCGVGINIAIETPPDVHLTGTPALIHSGAVFIAAGQSFLGPIYTQKYRYFACASPWSPFDSATSVGNIILP